MFQYRITALWQNLIFLYSCEKFAIIWEIRVLFIYLITYLTLIFVENIFAPIHVIWAFLFINQNVTFPLSRYFFWRTIYVWNRFSSFANLFNNLNTHLYFVSSSKTFVMRNNTTILRNGIYLGNVIWSYFTQFLGV